VAERSTWPLGDLLDNRRWVRRAEPFAHAVAHDVFVPEFYAELERQFITLMAEHPEAFHRDMKGYDAAGAVLREGQDGPLGIFVSREWHDLVAAVAGVAATGDVSASLHHHGPGGRSGWPHNDLNPGWFGGQPVDGEIILAGRDGVSYQTGDHPAGVPARRTVRAVSVLFYLANPVWSSGDGGETGLYRGLRDRQPVAVVPPINNSLLLFECTPYSFHGFVGNRVSPRNSLVMWVHRDYDEAVARWGEDSIVRWS